MDLVDRKKEVIVMAPTGLASNKIGGSTYSSRNSNHSSEGKNHGTTSVKTTLVRENNFYLMSRQWSLQLS